MEALRSRTDLRCDFQTPDLKPLRSYGSLQANLGLGNVYIIEPTEGQTDFATNGLYRILQLGDFMRYRYITATDDSFTAGSIVQQADVTGTQLQAALDAGTTYYTKVIPMLQVAGTAPDPDLITVAISGGTTLPQDGTRQLSVSVENSTQGVTWSSSDDGVATVDSVGEVTYVSGAVDDTVTITATSVEDGTKSDDHVLTITEASTNLNTRAGDEQALKEFYEETQGQIYVTVSDVSDLPTLDEQSHKERRRVSNETELKLYEWLWDEDTESGSWSFIGDIWVNTTGWANPDLDNPPSGITTALRTGDNGEELRVINMDVRENGVTGHLNESLGNLSKMEYVNFKLNFLTGEIPASIAGWAGIKTVYFSGRYGDDLPSNPDSGYHGGKDDDSLNTFEGTMPDVFDSWPNLEIFQLSGSDLTYIFHPSIRNCTNLKRIECSFNQQNFQELPSGMFDLMTGLEWFYVRTNNMKGSIPSTSSLTELRYWHIGNGNGFSGSIDFSNSTKMRFFNCDNQRNGSDGTGGLTGSLGTYWFDGDVFDNIVELRVGASYLDIPAIDWSNVRPQFNNFNVNGNNCDAELNTNIALMTNLEIFSVRWTIHFTVPDSLGLSGELPQSGLENWTHNRYFGVNDSRVTGAIPSNLPNSHHFYLNDAEFTSADPQAFIDVWNNGTTGEPVSENTDTVNIHGNRLTPKDFEPLIDFYDGKGVTLTFGDQKPFGTVAWDEEEESISVGDTIDRSAFDYSGNSYQWLKDGEEIAGETSHTIDTTNYGGGNYRLHITHSHSSITQTFISKPVLAE